MITVVLTALATLALTLIALNFITHERKIEKRIPRLYGSDAPQFRRTMGLLLGPAIVGGNKVQTLNNGDDIFPAMLAAIRGARLTLTFETYIYWSGGIGREFADALQERARAGVKVHVLIDWVGSLKMDDTLLDELERAGVEIERYHPLHWYHIARLNNRTHRKLLVVDGRVGFTGGVGIADRWCGNAQDPDHWRDIHYRVEGPVVAQLQAVFLDNWMKVSGKVLHGDGYFPALEAAGEASAQMFSSSPSGGGESMRLMYLLSITAAGQAIRLSASYFVPDALTIRTLVQARERGVAIQVIVPGAHIDAETVRRASRAKWGALLEAGVEIYEYQPTMFHCKVMVVDEVLVSVGSTNFDTRSFSLNDEANLNVYDAQFAREQIAVFERDRARAHRISVEAWRRRPWREKLWEHTAALLSSQL
jgi:cardiolipin synthase